MLILTDLTIATPKITSPLVRCLYSTYRSYCGCLGMERRRDYVALGDVVKLAADMAAGTVTHESIN